MAADIRSAVGAALALAALALWSWALRLPGISLPMMSDEGGYAYEAILLGQGDVPYRDAYDQKPPVVYFLYRLAFRVFGFGERGPRLLALLFAWATMVLLFSLSPPEWPIAARLAAPAAYAAMSAEPIGDMGFAAVPEAFLGLFLAASARFLIASWHSASRGRWLFLSGAAAALAVMTKQTAAWPAAVFFLLALWERRTREAVPARRVREAACFILGAAAAAAPFLIFFWNRGALPELWDQAFRRNLDYSAVMLSPGAVPLQVDWLRRVVLPLFMAGDWPVWVLALAGLLAPRPTNDRREILYTAWLAAAVVATATGFYFFPHYFLQLHPPLALAAAMGVRRLSVHRPGLAAAAVFSLASIPARSTRGHSLIRRSWRPSALCTPIPQRGPPGRRIHPPPQPPEDRIYVFGSEPQSFVGAGRRAATRHMYVFPLTLFPRDPALIDRELADLARERPRFLVYVGVPSSTLIASSEGARLRDGVRLMARQSYDLIAEIPVLEGGGGAPGTAALAPQGALPDWSREDRLWIFELRADK